MILPSKTVDIASRRAVARYADSELPTRHGTARFLVYREIVRGQADPGHEHVAFVIGEPKIEGPEPVLVRVHSECLTSEVFGSLKCDCRDQLDGALERMHRQGAGILLYLRQEGRGIGLGNKIRAYALQAQGADTIQANHQLGFETDLRTYDIAAGMLEDLGVNRVALMTNNPEKIQGLEKHGIEVAERVSIEMVPNLHSEPYLLTKRDKLGHLLEVVQLPAVSGE